MIRPAGETAATGGYVHGHRRCEQERLDDQAGALAELLHAGTAYPPGSAVLEVGCGVGSQTVTLARRSPNARFASVDVSADSVRLARRRVAAAGLTNVGLYQADLFALPFRPTSFDHAFICFVLEHLSRPREALEIVRGLLRPGGTVTVVEGDHGSAFCHPDSEAARVAIACQVELQRRAGGDALIGRRLYPLLADAGRDRLVADALDHGSERPAGKSFDQVGTGRVDIYDSWRHLGGGVLTRIRARSIGFVFQTFNLIPTLNAADNVAMALVPQHTAAAERQSRAQRRR